MSSVPTPEEIYQQILWIAKGVTLLCGDMDFRYGVERELMLSPIFEATNANIHQSTIMNYNYYYSDSLYKKLNTSFLTHAYNPLYFSGFTSINNYNKYFVIRSPELDIKDTSKQHIIIPENILLKDTSHYLAYFLNGSAVDSLVVDFDDLDNYYIWIVGLDQVSKLNKNSGCNNNGRCEPWLGETMADCEDCQNQKPPVLNSMGKLFLQKIKSKIDDKNYSGNPKDDYEEGYLKSKYELAFHYFSVSGDHVESQSGSLAGKEEDAAVYNIFNAWGDNCDIKRRKLNNNGNVVTNRGIENKVKTVHELLDEDFNMNSDSLYFVFYEGDPTFGTIRAFDVNWLGVTKSFRSFRTPISKYNNAAQTHVINNTNLQGHILTLLPPFIQSPYRSGWTVVGQIGGRDIVECTVETTEFEIVFRIEPTR